jgi:hypothetical protein
MVSYREDTEGEAKGYTNVEITHTHADIPANNGVKAKKLHVNRQLINRPSF